MKTVLLIWMTAFCFCLIVACSNEGSKSAGSDDKKIVRTDRKISWEKGKNVYEIPGDTGNLTLKGFPVYTKVFLSKTNPDDTIIPMAKTHYVTGGSNISLSSSSVQSRNAALSDSVLAETGDKDKVCHSMQLSEALKNKKKARTGMKKSRDATVSKKLVDKTLDENGQPKTFSLGHKKHFYLDIENDDEGEAISWRSEGEGSLEGIGYREDGSPLCYVWVLGQVTGYDDKDGSVLFTEESSLTTEKTAPIGKVNRAMAQDYADTFVKIYHLDREIFGSEPTKAFCDGESVSDIKYLSETGSVINLLFYDVYHMKENVTTCGFYWGKDLYPNDEHLPLVSDIAAWDKDDPSRYSNEGNYLYINTYMSKQTGNMYTTIAHELQHMIQRNAKGGLDGVDDETNYLSSEFNEMFSNAAEDLVFMFFPEIDYNNYAAVTYMRKVVEKYLYNGIEYNHAMSELVYGSTFSFIGWLMRTYSVAAMVSIAQNEYLDWEGIVKGVNALTDENGKHYSESIESLLRDYSAACIRGMKASASQEELYFTARAPSEEGKGVYCREENYGYPLIDIKIKGLNTAESTGFSESDTAVWKQKFPAGIPDNFGQMLLTGFHLYDANQVADLRPYGMMLHNVGSTTSDDDTVLTFSSDSEPSPMEKLYLVIICK